MKNVCATGEGGGEGGGKEEGSIVSQSEGGKNTFDIQES